MADRDAVTPGENTSDVEKLRQQLKADRGTPKPKEKPGDSEEKKEKSD